MFVGPGWSRDKVVTGDYETINFIITVAMRCSAFLHDFDVKLRSNSNAFDVIISFMQLVLNSPSNSVFYQYFPDYADSNAYLRIMRGALNI